MKIIALYRMYYGEDFIKMSIDSIYPYVDELIVFWTDRPWGNVREAKYRGKIIPIPDPIDNAIRIVKLLQNTIYPRIKMVYNTFPTSDNILTELYNGLELTEGNVVIFIEPDMIFDDNGIKILIKHIINNRFGNIYTKQVELWKTHEYFVKHPGIRPGAIVMDLRDSIQMPRTMKNCLPYGPVTEFDVTIFNFGYCISPQSMFWKIMVSLAFTTVVHDSIPDENWYEDTWLTWDYEKNNKDLEISKNYRSNLPRAEKYTGPLPEIYLKSLQNA